MAEPLSYAFEMTPEFARAALPTLEQALWLQNERLYLYWAARMRFRAALRWVGILLSACSLLMAAVSWATLPRHTIFFGLMSAAFAGLLVIFILAPRIALALRRFARRTAARNAGKLLRPVAARAPYTILYELSESSLLTRAEAVNVSSTFDLRQVRVAIETPGFICAFRTRFAQWPRRVLYVPGPRELAALRAALAASGAEILHLPPA